MIKIKVQFLGQSKKLFLNYGYKDSKIGLLFASLCSESSVYVAKLVHSVPEYNLSYQSSNVIVIYQ